jgi:hypothetical protein
MRRTSSASAAGHEQRSQVPSRASVRRSSERRSRSVLPNFVIRKIRRLLPEDRSHELLRRGTWITAQGLFFGVLLACLPTVLREILRPYREAPDPFPAAVPSTPVPPRCMSWRPTEGPKKRRWSLITWNVLCSLALLRSRVPTDSTSKSIPCGACQSSARHSLRRHP